MLRCAGYLVALSLALSGMIAASAETPAPTTVDPLATAFGTMPIMRDMRLSPDGSKMSYLSMSQKDMPVLVIYDLKTQQLRVILSSVQDKADIVWCHWANEERLLCSLYGLVQEGFYFYPATRLVAVNSDGSQMKVLLQDALRDEFSQFQDRIVDWLVDDPRHVLIQVPKSRTSSVVSLDIYSGHSVHTVMGDRENVRRWISDGRGVPRIYEYFNGTADKWYYRPSDSNSWHLLHEAKATDDDDFNPVGFGDNPDQLMVLKPHEKHQALWSLDLKQNLAEKLIYARPDADIGGVVELGKFKRLVAASYATDSDHLHFFDPEIEKITDRLGTAFSGQQIAVLDESWDKSVYLVNISSPRDPGKNFFYFSKQGELQLIAFDNPLLAGVELAEVKPIDYTASDGVKIPGYLTLPQGRPAKMLPTIILPHGGPQSRDHLQFDWLLQYLVAKGYAVLQSNYRGSGGFGQDWAGQGGWKAWRQAISDLTDGTNWLVKQGIADPNRICVVGWSYGGYAALMSAVEHSDLYRCVVSIAGVTDPWTLITDAANFEGGKKDALNSIGTESEVLSKGSPLHRVAEIKIPVLMFHGERDVNVPVRHSENMDKALKKAGKSSQFVFYKGTDHQIDRNLYRIDMLDKIGVFLEKNLGATAPAVAVR